MVLRSRETTGVALAAAGLVSLVMVLAPAPLVGQDGQGGASPARVLPPGAQATAPTGWIGIRLEHTVTTGPDGRRVEGVHVTGVVAGSPAESAGILPGDRLLRVGGVEASRALEEGVFGRIRPGDPVEVSLLRNGRPAQVTIRAAALPSPASALRHQEELAQARSELARLRADSVRHVVAVRLDSVRAGLVELQRTVTANVGGDPRSEGVTVVVRQPYTGVAGAGATEPRNVIRFRPGTEAAVPADPELQRVLAARVSEPRDRPPLALTVMALGERTVLGAEMVPMNPGLAPYFGVDAGVLVADVVEATPAARGGLRPGDVVTRVQGEAVGSVAEFRIAVDRGLRSPPVQVEVIRARERLTLRLDR
jgi:membrane-associated protease RseP (regulator of RpoE activity)